MNLPDGLQFAEQELVQLAPPPRHMIKAHRTIHLGQTQLKRIDGDSSLPHLLRETDDVDAETQKAFLAPPLPRTGEHDLLDEDARLPGRHRVEQRMPRIMEHDRQDHTRRVLPPLPARTCSDVVTIARQPTQV